VAQFGVADELVEYGLAADAGRSLFQFAICHAVKFPYPESRGTDIELWTRSGEIDGGPGDRVANLF
jgi:hypothetical protein